MNTLNNDTFSLQELIKENTRCIKQEMHGKFLDQSTQINELNMEIRALRHHAQESRRYWQLTILRWILGFLIVVSYIMVGILILKK